MDSCEASSDRVLGSVSKLVPSFVHCPDGGYHHLRRDVRAQGSIQPLKEL